MPLDKVAVLDDVRGGVLVNGKVYRDGYTSYMDRKCSWSYRLPTSVSEACTWRHHAGAQNAGTEAANKAGVPIMEDVPSTIRPDLDPGGRQVPPI
jgi:hypothetical protein